MCVTKQIPYVMTLTSSLTVDKLEEVIYFHQIKRGNIVIVIGGCRRGPPDPDTRRAYVLPQDTMKQCTQLSRVVPALNRLSFLRVWSGIEGYMPDDIPMMGLSPRAWPLLRFRVQRRLSVRGLGVGDVTSRCARR
jgi:sarcosine oxidase subunit beta